MDKNKIKEALKKKLRQEMSMTGTGATVTPGVGAGVATKYAFGKRDNKGTPSDWKAAPSIPNRPSKAMDYKELWEIDETWDFNTGGVKAWDYGKITPENMEAVLSKIINKLDVTEDDLAGIRNRAQELYNDSRLTKDELNFYLNTSLEDFKGMFSKSIDEAYDKSKIKTNADELAKFPNWKWTEQGKAEFSDALNENYARFRNETKTRTKPEQFHSAVKDIKKKVNEINRLFEYMNRLQSELSESEGGLKYKKYTEKSIQQIKESTKQLFFKSTKLK